MATSSNNTAAEIDLEIYRGSTFDKTYTVTRNGSSWDISGMTGRLNICAKAGDDAEVLSVTTASGLTFGDGTMRIVMSYALTEALSKGRYVWDVIGKESGVVYPIARGTVNVVERVTDPDDIT